MYPGCRWGDRLFLAASRSDHEVDSVRVSVSVGVGVGVGVGVASFPAHRSCVPRRGRSRQDLVVVAYKGSVGIGCHLCSWMLDAYRRARSYRPMSVSPGQALPGSRSRRNSPDPTSMSFSSRAAASSATRRRMPLMSGRARDCHTPGSRHADHDTSAAVLTVGPAGHGRSSWRTSSSGPGSMTAAGRFGMRISASTGSERDG